MTALSFVWVHPYSQNRGCDNKIEVTDSKPFKKSPQNIPTGLLDEVKEHLDHSLKVGVIKPSKLAWTNAVALSRKKDGGLRFCIDFHQLNS